MRQKQSKRKSKRINKNRRNTNQWPESKFIPQPFGDASSCGWFWKNYSNALEWQENHYIAYWKSRSMALEYENNVLHQYLEMYAINGENYGQVGVPKITEEHNGCTHSSKGNEELEHNHKMPDDNCEQDESNEEEEFKFEFQVTEEMMDFFEQSIRHKMELKKERENLKKEEEKLKSDSDDGSSILPPRKQVGYWRNKQMKLMYGKAAPMIMGMETAIQLSFDRNCDLKQPKLWPNIPLKL